MTPSIARLDSRSCVRVTGPDARSFLQGLLTQDVLSLAPGELRYGALLNPPGRLLFDLFLLGLEDGVLLDVSAPRRAALIQRLTLYRLRAQVEIQADDSPVHAHWGSQDEALPPDPRRPELGYRSYGRAAAPTSSDADYEAHQMALGVPGPADWPDDSVYPIEANFDLLNGIDFAKGCFVGQETTSRMKRRGKIKSRMMPVALDPDRAAAVAVVGGEILNGELRAGSVTSVIGAQAMAVMRLDRLDGTLTLDGQPVRVERPDWLPLPSGSA